MGKTKQHSSDQNKKVMGRVCGMYGGRRDALKVLAGGDY